MSNRCDTLSLLASGGFQAIDVSGEQQVVSSSLEAVDDGARREQFMSNDPDKVWPTGLTLREAEELHSYIIDGTRGFGFFALLAHILAYFYSPWLG